MTLPAFRRAASDVANSLNPWRRLAAVVLRFDDGTEISLPINGPEPTPAKETPSLSDKQTKIILALMDGPCKGETLASLAGLANATSLYQGRGLTQLRDGGFIEMTDSGFALTREGRRLANELEKGGDEC